MREIKKLSSTDILLPGIIMKLKAYLLSGFFAKVGFTLTLFLVNILIARVLGAAGSGSFFYVVNNLSVIVLLASLSLESGLSFHLSKKNINESDAASLSMVWSFALSLLAAAALLLMPGVFHGFTENEFWFAFLFIAGNLLISFFSGLFYAKKEFVLPLLILAIANLLIIVYCSWILLNKHDVNLILLSWIYSGSYLLSGLGIAVLFLSKYSVQSLWQGSLVQAFKTIRRYSLVAFGANLIAFLVYRIDYWILEYYIPKAVSNKALGNYIQTGKLLQLFLFVPTVIATVIFPLTVAEEKSSTPAGIKKIIFRLTTFNLVLIAIVVAIGSWWPVFLYGSDFDLVYTCFLYLIPGVLAICCVRVLASYFAGKNKVHYNITGSVLALGLIVTLNFLLIPSMGINGAALADSAGYMVYFLFLYYQFKKNSGA
jgi:O-antigen/teichoic acid export membrane protein